MQDLGALLGREADSRLAGARRDALKRRGLDRERGGRRLAVGMVLPERRQALRRTLQVLAHPIDRGCGIPLAQVNVRMIRASPRYFALRGLVCGPIACAIAGHPTR